MNLAKTTYEELMSEWSSETNFEKRSSGAAKGSRPKSGFGRRRGKSPEQFNGIHRRRRKQIRW